MSYRFDNEPHFIVYNAMTGEVHFDRLRSDGKGYEILNKDKWGKGWTHFMPFRLENSPAGDLTHFIAYNSATGKVHFDRFTGAGGTYEILSKDQWALGWTHFFHYYYGSNSYFIAYNATTGKVHFNQFSQDGRGYKILGTNIWGKGWTHFIPFVIWFYPGPGTTGIWQWFLIAYNNNTGVVHYDRLLEDGNSYIILWEGQWFPGFNFVMPWRWIWRQQGGTSQNMPGHLVYNPDSGMVSIDVEDASVLVQK